MPGLGAALRFSPAVVEAPVARPAPKTVAKRRRPVSAEQPPTEVATDFLPMQPGPILSRDEALQLVRITLPRTEMLRFGLPVAPGPRGARVMADVVLGEDGIARAIRFVR
ncbi:MAG: hypothetical protein NTY38_18275 [Acidobacteria bacterium]|nr:hypothetical protein [Acidobacteriota bacterium]